MLHHQALSDNAPTAQHMRFISCWVVAGVEVVRQSCNRSYTGEGRFASARHVCAVAVFASRTAAACPLVTPKARTFYSVGFR